jgi:hypothetical protein
MSARRGPRTARLHLQPRRRCPANPLPIIRARRRRVVSRRLGRRKENTAPPPRFRGGWIGYTFNRWRDGRDHSSSRRLFVAAVSE